ncbi:hypothetical protein GCM10010472_35110 [Pseudonocardia halophobica]|uniref:SnoaL-like domain-containing protein n=1 Tax=Pseudonocardia halophobica TaxID=29401 RepID=A0A9W6L3D6_9PSEU|nr:hypothetical protein [Pseudonocardia halophobica]GLL12150.1 hypothetical protein GCM10017577_32910 [Pseudonocardia halophobica]
MREDATLPEWLAAAIGALADGDLNGWLAMFAPDDAVVRATGHHRRLDGAPVTLDYIWFITRRNGKVTHLQDHANPRAAERR